MKKTIICLYAPANRGKTNTIRSLFIKLGGDKNVLNGTHDFVADVNFGRKKIGFVSQGDPGSPQNENLEKLAQGNCEIIVTASRTKGDTVYAVYDIANKYGYDVVCIGYDPYNAKDFINRWEIDNGDYNIVKVIQGAKTESVPLGELKKLSEERLLLFDEDLMSFAMGNCITLEDTNGNRKLYKKRYDQKIDNVAAMMDAYVAYKLCKDSFD